MLELSLLKLRGRQNDRGKGKRNKQRANKRINEDSAWPNNSCILGNERNH